LLGCLECIGLRRGRGAGHGLRRQTHARCPGNRRIFRSARSDHARSANFRRW
jgi:hypothetical protein